MTLPKDTSQRPTQAPIERCFPLDKQKAHDACSPVKKNTQLAQDCRALIDGPLSFFARSGVENFRINHADEARRLEMTELRVKKAIARLKQAGVIEQTVRQAPGVAARFRINPKFADKLGQKALQQELRAAVAEAKREVLRTHNKPSFGRYS